MVDLIFKKFLFASHFKAEEEKANGTKKEIQLVQRHGENKAGGQSKGAAENTKSREAAFALLTELVKKSDKTMQNFLK